MSSDSASAAIAARGLMRSAAAGILATQSVAVEGYPLGSVVPFALMPDGRCVVYVSRIAQHTKNFEQDQRASLTVVEADLSGQGGDPQALGRVSLLGDASRLEGADLEVARARYETFFPESRGHSGVHDFDYWAIEPVRVRYIAGFGAIHWVEREAFCLPTAEWQAGETGIVAHMNDDHRDAMALIWQQRCGTPPSQRTARSRRSLRCSPVIPRASTCGGARRPCTCPSKGTARPPSKSGRRWSA